MSINNSIHTERYILQVNHQPLNTIDTHMIVDAEYLVTFILMQKIFVFFVTNVKVYFFLGINVKENTISS